MSVCVGESTLLAFVQGGLSDEELARVDEHLATCSVCRMTVAAAVASEPALFGRLEQRTSAVSPVRTLADRYELAEPLGAGGMGVVFVAYDRLLRRKVAVKLLRAERVGRDSKVWQRRMLREARAMAKLSHPHVVAVHDAGLFEGGVFIVMELVEGTTLAAWDRGPRRSWREVVAAYVPAARGLAAAHRAGLIHRDFKPANVLRGNDGRVRVTDFGLATRHDDRPRAPEQEGDVTRAPSSSAFGSEVGGADRGADVSTAMTHTEGRAGTPAFMAPERFRGSHGDAASDQFSFGIALHEALFGERPFKGGSMQDLAAAVMTGQRAPLPAAHEVPEWLCAIVSRTLATAAQDRFASMDDVADALEAGGPSRASTRSRRRGRLLLGGVVASAALATAVVAGLARTSSTTRSPSTRAAGSEGVSVSTPSVVATPIEGVVAAAATPPTSDTAFTARPAIGDHGGDLSLDAGARSSRKSRGSMGTPPRRAPPPSKAVDVDAPITNPWHAH